MMVISGVSSWSYDEVNIVYWNTAMSIYKRIQMLLAASAWNLRAHFDAFNVVSWFHNLFESYWLYNLYTIVYKRNII